MSRTSIYAVPDKPMKCIMSSPCPYREQPGSVCPEPRTSKGNSDAACFRMNNKDLIGTWLRPIDG